MATGPTPAGNGELDTCVMMPVGVEHVAEITTQIAKLLMSFDPEFAIRRYCPPWGTSRAEGAVPTAYGEPATTVSFPEVSKENADTVFVNWLATYRKLPEGGMANATGPVGTLLVGSLRTGEPTAAKVVPLIENTDMSLDPWLAAKRNFPVGSTANPMGVVPVAVVPLTEVNEPSELIWYALIEFEALFATNRALIPGVIAMAEGAEPVVAELIPERLPELSPMEYDVIVVLPCVARYRRPLPDDAVELWLELHPDKPTSTKKSHAFLRKRNFIPIRSPCS